jgi:hypothetical protein
MKEGDLQTSGASNGDTLASARGFSEQLLPSTDVHADAPLEEFLGGPSTDGGEGGPLDWASRSASSCADETMRRASPSLKQLCNTDLPCK